MKAVVLTFDSLNRHLLAPYGCAFSETPQFTRLAERALTFDRAYVGSMPCMPARREMHTGRYNFLHRAWGGLEPFDRSMPQMLAESGIHTHHCTDHYHYWEDGGNHYMQRYSTHEFFRGQEGDLWKPQVELPQLPRVIFERPGRWPLQDEVNRQHIRQEEDWPMHRTVSAGLEFLERNHQADNWFLHIETFDPHEPFYAPQKYRDLFKHDFITSRADWPPYGRTDFFGFDEETVSQIRAEYLALLAFCDAQLGRLLDAFDEKGLWEDTLLIVNTDHGFFLGERDLLGKNIMPLYNELARVPLFVWDPRHGHQGERRDSLVQTIDFAPTLLEYFGVEPPAEMQGHAFRPVVQDDTPVRQCGLFGYHGGHLNLVTADGWTLFRRPLEERVGDLFHYTLNADAMRGFLDLDSLREATLHPPFSFTRGMPVLKIPKRDNWTRLQAANGENPGIPYADFLFNTRADPGQTDNLAGRSEKEAALLQLMRQLLEQADAPPETAPRFGL